MDFGTWLDLREELMMLVITGSNSLLLSLMSQVGIGSNMQLFAGATYLVRPPFFFLYLEEGYPKIHSGKFEEILIVGCFPGGGGGGGGCMRSL